MGYFISRTSKTTEPSYDAIAARISTLGFIKLRELSRDYREYGSIRPFRSWLAETIDRQLDEEGAKSWEDRHFFHTGDY